MRSGMVRTRSGDVYKPSAVHPTRKRSAGPPTGRPGKKRSPRNDSLGEGTAMTKPCVWIILAAAVLGWPRGIATSVVFRLRRRIRTLVLMEVMAETVEETPKGARWAPKLQM